MKSEWHAQCQMCTFPGCGCSNTFGATYLSSWRQDWSRRRRVLRGFIPEDDRLEQAWLMWDCGGTYPPMRSELARMMSPRRGMPAPNSAVALQMQQGGLREPKDSNKSDPEVHFCQRDNYFQRSRIYHYSMQHTNGKTVHAFWNIKIQEGHSGFIVRFT